MYTVMMGQHYRVNWINLMENNSEWMFVTSAVHIPFHAYSLVYYWVCYKFNGFYLECAYDEKCLF